MSASLRVALDARPLTRPLTGVGKFVHYLSQGLVNSGVEVVWLSDDRLVVSHPQIRSVIWSAESTSAWEQHLAQQLTSLKVDVYHATSNTGIPSNLPVPSLLTLHDLIPHRLPWRYFFGANVAKAPEYYRRQIGSLRQASHICADSRATADDIRWLWPWAGPKTSVVHLGLEPIRRPSVSAIDKLRASLGLTQPYWVYFGGIDPRKNLKRLIRSFALTEARLSHQLVIAGSGAEYLRDYISQCGLEQQVLLPGYVSDQDKYALLAGAVGLCYPSLYEGFGYPPLESMAVGTPVVTSRNSSLTEICGDAAVLVDPGNTQAIAQAIDQVTSDQQLRSDLIQQGKLQVAEFNWSKTVDQYVQAYHGCVTLP